MVADGARDVTRRAWNLGIETYEQWRDHRTIRLGAGLAYYGLFALVPMLAVALALAGLVISQADVQSYLTEQLSALLGVDADAVAGALASVLDGSGTVAGLGAVGVASLFLTASLLVLALQDAFNTIWERPVRSGIRQTVVRRLVAFLVVAGAGAVIIVSFALNAVTGLLDQLVPDVAIVTSLQELIGLATSWALAIGVVALLFRYLTDVRVPWRAAVVGAVVTSVMLAVGTVLVGAYLRRFASSSLVGATGSVFLVLLWIYYEAQIVLMGAEFTRVLALPRGMAPGQVEAVASARGDGEAGGAPGHDAAVDVGS
ncbi:MAG TPA: YihY/virulence factor BrkB family protein [Ilumatobacteraceae bacterium]|nr:YihY/virulence factor BrkB family protein [Ilumatobacteraceae bacterium]